MADIWDSFNDFILDFAVVDDRDVTGDDNVSSGSIPASGGSAVAIGGDSNATQDHSVDFDLDDSSDSDDDGLTQVAIIGSFNSDDVVANNDGYIDDSVVAGGGIEDSLGTDIDAGIDDSFYDIDQTGLANVNLDDTLDLEIGDMFGNNDIDLL